MLIATLLLNVEQYFNYITLFSTMLPALMLLSNFWSSLYFYLHLFSVGLLHSSCRRLWWMCWCGWLHLFHDVSSAIRICGRCNVLYCWVVIVYVMVCCVLCEVILCYVVMLVCVMLCCVGLCRVMLLCWYVVCIVCIVYILFCCISLPLY